jgi:hypothetical protein
MRAAGLGAWRRVRAAWLPVALASLAAALSWLIAHRVLGHPQPFFAPIAAAIALSTSRIKRSIRIAQMVSGVLLGIAIGELLVAAERSREPAPAPERLSGWRRVGGTCAPSWMPRTSEPLSSTCWPTPCSGCFELPRSNSTRIRSRARSYIETTA